MRTLKSDPPEEMDNQAFMQWLYQEFYRLMFFTVKRLISETGPCEDIVQESLVKLTRNVDKLRGKSRHIMAAYVTATVRNTAINYLKKEGMSGERCSSLDDDAFPDLAAPSPPLEELVQLAEQKTMLAKVLGQLSAEDRALLEGKYILGDSDETLAHTLNCKPSSIRMKLTRARRRALKLLEQEGADFT